MAATTTAPATDEAITLFDVYPGDKVTGFPGMATDQVVTIASVEQVDTAVHMTPLIRVAINNVAQWGASHLLPQDTALVRVARRERVVLDDYDLARDAR